MVLVYSGVLPPGALVRVTAGALAPRDLAPEALAVPAPVWLSAGTGMAFSEAGRVIGWQAQTVSGTPGAQGTPGPEARAVAANVSGTGYRAAPPALRFEAEVNGGLVLTEAIPEGTLVTFGMIYTPAAPDARTLLSLQVRGQEDYLFLSAEGAVLRLGQKGGEADLSLPLEGSSGRPVLLICALGGGMVRVAVNGGAALSMRCDLHTGPADLFIGCRGTRGGLRNKLGSFEVTDVMVWPGADLLSGSSGRSDLDLGDALMLWRERCGSGL